jgi:hypothetical protein
MARTPITTDTENCAIIRAAKHEWLNRNAFVTPYDFGVHVWVYHGFNMELP